LKSHINSLPQIKGSLNENMQIIMRRLSDSAVEIDDLKSIPNKRLSLISYELSFNKPTKTKSEIFEMQ
jgi:hypothetical protein